MGLQESEAARASKDREAATAVAERDAMQEKLKEAEKAAQELREGFGAEESKSVEMAAELLTLVNQKTHLETVKEDLERQVDDFSSRVRMLELDLRTARDDMRGLREDTEVAQKKAGVLEIAKAKAELDLQRAQVEWESQALDNHRSTVARDNTRQAELLDNHMQDLAQLAKLKEDNEALRKGQDQLRVEVKKCERRCEQAQEETARKEKDLATNRDELVEANEELDRLRRKFRDQLENLVNGKAGTKASRRKKDDQNNDGCSGDASKRAALEEMVGSYKEREERATADAKRLREEARDARLKNRALFDRYKQLRGILEDSLGVGELPPDLPSDDKLIAAGAVAAGGRESDTEAQSALKARLKVAESELSAQQEKNVLAAGEYSERVATLEQQLREDSLQIGRLEHENLSLSKALDNASGGQQLQDMQAMVMKMASAPAARVRTPPSPGGSRDMRVRVRQAEEERDRALNEVATLRLEQRSQGRCGGGHEVQELVKELERIERTNAALVSTKATLESELLRFKEYMRETVSRYQETIRQLQQELKKTKGGFG
ncbi:unnamed protein product [Ectocarpus sp. 12 AP-2014]